MKFEFHVEMGRKYSFDERVSHLAKFEIILNILRMKAKKGDSIEDEVSALCGFAIKTLFDLEDLSEDKTLENIINLKNIRVDKYRKLLLKDSGMSSNGEVGEA